MLMLDQDRAAQRRRTAHLRHNNRLASMCARDGRPKIRRTMDQNASTADGSRSDDATTGNSPRTHASSCFRLRPLHLSGKAGNTTSVVTVVILRFENGQSCLFLPGLCLLPSLESRRSTFRRCPNRSYAGGGLSAFQCQQQRAARGHSSEPAASQFSTVRSAAVCHSEWHTRSGKHGSRSRPPRRRLTGRLMGADVPECRNRDSTTNSAPPRPLHRNRTLTLARPTQVRTIPPPVVALQSATTQAAKYARRWP
jgi:hypothetical protein